MQQRIKFSVLAVLGVYCTLVLIASVYLQIYWLFFLLIVCLNALILLVTGRFFVRLFIFPFSVFVARNMVEVLQNEKLCKELYTLNNYVQRYFEFFFENAGKDAPEGQEESKEKNPAAENHVESNGKPPK